MKPCPFCGNNDIELYPSHRKDHPDRYWIAYCSRCSAEVSTRDKQTTTEKWDTRQTNED